MNQRPSHYERAKLLIEESFGIDLPAVGILTENQFKVEYPETEFTPAEVVMEIHVDYNLDFK